MSKTPAGTSLCRLSDCRLNQQLPSSITVGLDLGDKHSYFLLDDPAEQTLPKKGRPDALVVVSRADKNIPHMAGLKESGPH